MNNTSTLNLPFASKILFTITWKSVFKVFLIFSALLIISFLILYVFQTNREVSERYLIKGYEKKIDGLVKSNQALEIGLVRANSLDNIFALMAELNFEKVEKIQYIQIRDNQVVAK